MKLPRSLSAVCLFFLFFLSTIGQVYFYLSLVLLALLFFYLSYQSFGKAFFYWILPFYSIVGAVLTPHYIGRTVIQFIFIVLATLIITFIYYIQERLATESKVENLDDISRVLHYFAALIIFNAGFSISFYSLGAVESRLVFNMLEWAIRLIVSFFVGGLTYSYVKLTILNLGAWRKSAFFFSIFISFLMLEVFWAISFLPVRYNVAGLILFLIYFIFMESLRYFIGMKKEKKRYAFYIFLAHLGIILALATSKWGF